MPVRRRLACLEKRRLYVYVYGGLDDIFEMAARAHGGKGALAGWRLDDRMNGRMLSTRRDRWVVLYSIYIPLCCMYTFAAGDVHAGDPFQSRCCTPVQERTSIGAVVPFFIFLFFLFERTSFCIFSSFYSFSIFYLPLPARSFAALPRVQQQTRANAR